MVPMRRFVLPCRNPVHIDVEQLRIVRLRQESRQARLFLKLAARGITPRRIGIVDMPAGLKPAVELAVMNHCDVRAGAIQYPGRSREVPLGRAAAPGAWYSIEKIPRAGSVAQRIGGG